MTGLYKESRPQTFKTRWANNCQQELFRCKGRQQNRLTHIMLQVLTYNKQTMSKNYKYKTPNRQCN